ncbi:AAA family ATPase [Pontibacter pudoricolor]|uniref:AAA family ATPase n=1 Tax=Pontibacter pudoricolor TaxID=2694930 RepID=UPI001390F7AA|nr:AAA family ATPase [Pontibacter pudoricolor]
MKNDTIQMPALQESVLEPAKLLSQGEALTLDNKHQVEDQKPHPVYREQTAKPKKNPKAIPLSEAIATAKDLPETEFLWSGINKKGVGFIFGQSKSGKTTLCENLGMSLAAGLDTFLGSSLLKTTPPSKVLFISLEEHYLRRLSRNVKQAKVISEKEGEDWKSNYLIVNHDMPLYMAGEKEWNILDKIIKDNKPEIVFIDSLTRLSGEAIEKSKVASELMRRLHELAKENDITLMVIHHTAKQAGKPLDMASLAGSRVIIQEADFAIGINKSRGGVRYIKEVAFRYKAEAEDAVLTFTLNSNGWLEAGEKTSEIELTEGYDRRQDDTNQREVLQFIKNNMKPEGVKTQTLIDGLVNTAIMSKGTMHTAIKKLIDSGKVTPKRGIYRLTDSQNYNK